MTAAASTTAAFTASAGAAAVAIQRLSLLFAARAAVNVYFLIVFWGARHGNFVSKMFLDLFKIFLNLFKSFLFCFSSFEIFVFDFCLF